MNKLYALLLLTWLLAGCATTSQVSTLPTDVYIATINAPSYFSSIDGASQTGIQFTQNQQVHILRRKKPNWIIVSYEGREVYISEGFTSPTQVDPATISRYSKPTTPTYSAPASSGRSIQTGPRGGKYYINGNGNKTYIKRK
jgi:hypothetical protein